LVRLAEEGGRIHPSSPGLRSAAIARGTLAATVTSTGMIAQQVAGKAVRDALFLSSYKVQHLPHAMAAASAVSLVVVLCLPVITTRISPRRFLPLLFLGSAIGLVLERLLYAEMPHLGAIAVYLHTTTVAPVIITTFWSLINERFDPHTAKREVARIAGGGTFGGVLGGLAAWRASTIISIPSSVLVLAFINVICLVAVLTMRAPAAKAKASLSPTSEPPTLSALRLFREAPFLRNLAILVGAGAALSSLLDYVLGVQAVTGLGKGEGLLAFFALFGLGVSVVSLFLQVLFGRLAMEKVGLAVHLGVLPGVIVLGGAFGLAVPGLVSTVILRGAEMVHRNTFFRSAYELLYTPIPELHKRATKALIDVGFDRFGTIVGSLLTMGLVYVISDNPHESQSILLGLVVICAIATLPLVRNLHVNYIDALEESLREGAKHLERSIAPSMMPEAELDRDRLLHTVAEIAPQPDDLGIAHATLARPEALLAETSDLLSNDETKVRAALEQLTSPAAAAPAIMLLGHPQLHRPASTALRRLGPRITGQLIDAMVDPEMDFFVRRRIPPILAQSPSQRAADGLFLALSDSRFEVRYNSGRALMHMVECGEDIELPREAIVKTILAEIAREQHYASQLGDEEDEADVSLAPLDVVTRDRVSRGLEHLFNELAILLGSEAVRICFRALHQNDPRSRGTALEYLQTVLPSELRDALWPLLGEDAPLHSVRPAADVLTDLQHALLAPEGVDRVEPRRATGGKEAERHPDRRRHDDR
jgi:hypothetical protein